MSKNISKKNGGSKNLVVWPVDVFEDNSDAAKPIRRLISAVFHESAELLPAYMLSFETPKTIPGIKKSIQAKWTERFIKIAQEKMDALTKTISWHKPLKGVVVSKETQSQRQLVGEFLKFCKLKNAKYIVTNTHGRSGLSRLFLGSFAETLITSSNLPILAVQPNAVVADSIKHILFATDFSKNSNAGYKMTLEIAKKIGADVILFHKRFSSVEPIVQSGVYMLGGGWVSTAQLLDDEEKATLELSKKWIQQAKQYGVSVNYVSNPADSAISNAIIETAKTKKADLIVVVNQTGRWGTVVLGSISRDLLRQAPVPILILHK